MRWLAGTAPRAVARAVGIAALFATLGLPPAFATAEYVRDEIRINVRTGPGLEFRIVSTLASGDRVRVLNEGEEWIQVRNGEGNEGWIPAGYLSAEPPASVALPQVRQKLEQAQKRVEELGAKLAEHSEAAAQLDTLRERAAELEAENLELSLSSRWRTLLAGGSIVLVGMLVGALLPRGGGNARQRKLRL